MTAIKPRTLVEAIATGLVYSDPTPAAKQQANAALDFARTHAGDPDVIAHIKRTVYANPDVIGGEGLIEGICRAFVETVGGGESSERRTVTFDHGAAWVGPGEAPPIDTRTTVDPDTGEVVDECPIDEQGRRSGDGLALD